MSESPASLTLGFEDPEEWTLVEGSGQLEASELTTDGSAALFVGGSNWRRIASVPLPTVGAATNALKIDVGPQGAPGNWENVGVVLEIPSKGIYWSDLGTASLEGLTPGQYTTLAFPVSESLRAILNTVYDDLVVRVSINSSTAVRLDNIRLSNQPTEAEDGGTDTGDSDEPELPTPPPFSNFSEHCSSSGSIQVLDIDSDIAEIWSGLEIRGDSVLLWREGQRRRSKRRASGVYRDGVKRVQAVGPRL